MQSPARRLVFLVAAASLAFSGMAVPAEAKAKPHKHVGLRVPAFLQFTAQPKYASIVIDARTGEVLYEQAPDAHRYPASITKIMTMYLAFEALHDGRLSLNDEIVVSPHAAAQAPSKLGLRQGQTISVVDAMSAIAVKSAIDMAVALAEKLGGNESHFAELMTAKAHQLGMNNTEYVNASGLPDTRQLSTARDIAILSRAVLHDYPQYYSFFGKREINWHGQITKNHNHLLGAMPGVDGIKTGFTNASGFYLAASAVRDDRRLIAVVMGGSSTAARDNHVEDLLDAGFPVMKKREVGQPTTIAQNLHEPAPIGVVDRPPVEQGDGDQGGVHILVDGKAPTKKAAAAIKAKTDDASCVNKRVRVHHKLVTRCIVPAVDHGKSAGRDKDEGGDWLVQVGAYKNPAQAREQLAHMNHKFAEILADSQGKVQHTAGNYRVRFAGLSAQGAKGACAKIEAKGQSCMVMKE